MHERTSIALGALVGRKTLVVLSVSFRRLGIVFEKTLRRCPNLGRSLLTACTRLEWSSHDRFSIEIYVTALFNGRELQVIIAGVQNSIPVQSMINCSSLPWEIAPAKETVIYIASTLCNWKIQRLHSRSCAFFTPQIDPPTFCLVAVEKWNKEFDLKCQQTETRERRTWMLLAGQKA